MKKDNYVWYAVYGSNLSRERFNVYIKGGKINTSCKIKEYHGCRCHCPPIDDKPYQIKHELYFYEKSPTWCGHGVAFIKSEECKSKELVTLGKIYLITKEQFNDILHQENSKEPPYDVYTVDFDRIIKNKMHVVGQKGWYTKILYLGEEESFPVFTLTGQWDDRDIDNNIKNLPSSRYRSYIIEGLRETNPEMSMQSICFYIGKMGGYNNFEKTLRVRKEWQCVMCDRIINIGEWATLHRYYVGRGDYAKDYYCNKCKPSGP